MDGVPHARRVDDVAGVRESKAYNCLIRGLTTGRMVRPCLSIIPHCGMCVQAFTYEIRMTIENTSLLACLKQSSCKVQVVTTTHSAELGRAVSGGFQRRSEDAAQCLVADSH